MNEPHTPQHAPAAPVRAPAVSVVLVSWNRREDLRLALDSIARQTVAREIEIIVVDNGSADGTPEMLAEWGGNELLPLKVYAAGSNLGASVARNLGMRLAAAPYVVFMDSDAELLDADLIQSGLSRFRAEPALGALGAAIYLDAERAEPWFLGGYYLPGGFCDQPRTRAESENPEYISTCYSMWPTELVRRLGGFDPALPYGFEDNDLSWRTLAAGRTLRVDASRAVRHHLSPVARIRPESAGWSHFNYDELARGRIQLKRLGLIGYLREESWQWRRAGRTQRYYIFLHAPLRRRAKWALYALGPLRTLASWPRLALNARANWIDRAPFDPARVVSGVRP